MPHEVPHEQNDFIIELVRHPETKYIGKGNDITTTGESQIATVANTILESIDPREERVLFWVSPTARTRTTAEVMERVLRESGIDFIRSAGRKSSDINSLVDLRRTDFTGPYIRANLSPEEIATRVVHRSNELLTPEKENRIPHRVTSNGQKIETEESILGRLLRVVEYSQRASEQVRAPENKSLRVILCTHLSLLQELLKQTGHLRTDVDGAELRELVPHAAHVQVRVHKINDKKSELTVSYQGEPKSVVFDRDTRSLHGVGGIIELLGE